MSLPMWIETRNLPCGRIECSGALNRRELLSRAGAGFGALALAYLLQRDGLLAQEKVAPKAKAVIWLYMEGGPSAVDLFDPKPDLTKYDGKQPPSKIETFFGRPGPLMKCPFSFKQYGESGAWVCDRYQKMAAHVDDIAFIKSCWAESSIKSPPIIRLTAGHIGPGSPTP